MTPVARLTGRGTFLAPPGIRPAGKWDLLPGGHRILGTNIIGYNDSLSTTGAWLGDFWFQWPWTTPGTGAAAVPIKPQIDAVKALGNNTIRFFGSQSVRAGSGTPYANQISTAQYLAQWDQLLSYCRSQGLYCIPTLGSDSNQEDAGGYTYTPTLSWFQTEYAIVCQFLRQYRDIIPFVDIANEALTWAGTSGQGAALYRTCKNAAPELLFSYSHDLHAAPGAAPQAAAVPPAGTYDLLQFHIYYDMGATDLDSYMNYYGLPIVLSEFGQNMNAGTAARQSRFTAVKNAMNNVTSGRQLAGAVAWTAAPQNTVGGIDDWGICDASLTPRADVQSIFTSFPS